MDLQGQFPGGSQDKYLGVPWLAGIFCKQFLQNRQYKSCGLARACLGQAQDIFSCQQWRDGLDLDGSGGDVPGMSNAGHDALIQRKGFKVHK